MRKRSWIIGLTTVAVLTAIGTVAVVAMTRDNAGGDGVLQVQSVGDTTQKLQQALDRGVPITQVGDIVPEIWFEKAKKIQLGDLPAYEYEAFVQSVDARGVVTNASSKLHGLDRFHEAFPLSFLAEIDDTHVYTVYRLVTEDGHETYAYTVFEKTLTMADDETSIWASWTCPSEYYFFDQVLTAGELEQIAVGASAKDICEIVPSVWFDSQWPVVSQTQGTFCAYLLTETGIVEVTFCAPVGENRVSPSLEAYTVEQVKGHGFKEKGGEISLLSGKELVLPPQETQ